MRDTLIWYTYYQLTRVILKKMFVYLLETLSYDSFENYFGIDSKHVRPQFEINVRNSMIVQT